MAEQSLKLTATLSNSYNSTAVAYQGGTSTSSSGATAKTRTGNIKWSGLSALAGKQITRASWYIAYGSIGKSATKTITFTTPSASYSTSKAYGGNETKTLNSSTNAVFFNSLVSAISAGNNTLTWKINNGETKTTHNFNSSSGSYTENYASITSSTLTIYYEDSKVPKYYNGSEWVKPKAAYFYNGTEWVKIKSWHYYDGSAWKDITS